jgi:hypothetical protein
LNRPSARRRAAAGSQTPWWTQATHSGSDEGVAVALGGGDDAVAQALEVVDRVLVVPAEDLGADAEVGGVAVGVAVGGDQRQLVDQDEVGLVRAVGVVAAVVAKIHVEDGAGDVAAAAEPGLPGAGGEHALAPVRLAGVGGGAAAAAEVGDGGSLVAAGAAAPVKGGAAGGVVSAIGEEEGVEIGARVAAGAAVAGEAVALRPGVLALVAAGGAADLGEGRVAVDVEDGGWVEGLLVRQLEDLPGEVGRVGDPLVVVDDRVERGAEDGSAVA